MTDDEPAPEESRRQIIRRQQHADGELSARLAKRLMTLPDSTLARLGLDDDLMDAVARSRAVTKRKARRRAERFLAGVLRAEDLADLEARIANVAATGATEPRLFKLAETWRERLIDESGVVAEFPGGARPELHALIHRARRERDTGKPRGAARALFQHVLAVLEAENDGSAGDPATGVLAYPLLPE